MAYIVAQSDLDYRSGANQTRLAHLIDLLNRVRVEQEKQGALVEQIA